MPTLEGAVEFQRETQYCLCCNKSTVHVRAVRRSDNWHSDWTCIKAVSDQFRARKHAQAFAAEAARK